ncbi:MAG: METTL5 family protein [Thermoplasmatales archaeon]
MNLVHNIRKSNLELLLSSLKTPENYNIELEQYNTPPPVASTILFRAAQEGNIAGKEVADLGCGNGIFAIGAAILGAARVYAIDKDQRMINLASSNAEMMDVKIEFINSDVSDFNKPVDTMILNPPFGSHRRGLDIPFIESAIKLSKHFYIILDYNSGDFLSKFIKSRGTVIWEEKSFIEIPRIYTFHRKEKTLIPVRISRVDVR